MTPYTVIKLDTVDVQREQSAVVTSYRLVGPGFNTKPYPKDYLDRLKELAELMNAAWAAGVRTKPGVVVGKTGEGYAITIGDTRLNLVLTAAEIAADLMQLHRDGTLDRLDVALVARRFGAEVGLELNRLVEVSK